MKTIWKWVVNYVGKYRVSNKGTIRSVDRVVESSNPKRTYFKKGRILKQWNHKFGYKTVTLSNSGTTTSYYLVHKLVLEAFVGPCPPGMVCRHFPDRNPANNNLTNISWGTPSQNIQDQWVHKTKIQKFTKRKICLIRLMVCSGLFKQIQVAKFTKSNRGTISKIVRGLERIHG